MESHRRYDEFRKAILAALRDEEEAIRTYPDIARLAPNPWLAWQVELIRRQQMQHAFVFAQVLQLLDWYEERYPRLT